MTEKAVQIMFESPLDARIELTSMQEEASALHEARIKNNAEAINLSRTQHIENKKSLKSDMKKSTAFVKRVKGITADGITQCIRETEVLNLNLYISEIVSGILDTQFKGNDVPHVAKLCSCLHKRYEEFTDGLLNGLRTSLLSISNEDDKDAPKRRRIQIRLLIELFANGVCTDDSLMLQIIRLLLGKRKPSKV